MTNTLVPHVIAVELKRLGFDWEVSNTYNSGVLSDSPVPTNFNHKFYLDKRISAPDIYQAAAWLRSKGVHVSAVPDCNIKDEIVIVWHCIVWAINGIIPQPKILRNEYNNIKEFPDHDTAYIAGILNGLKLVK